MSGVTSIEDDLKQSIEKGTYKKAKTFIINGQVVVMPPIGAKYICAACFAGSSQNLQEAKQHAGSTFGLHHAAGKCQHGANNHLEIQEVESDDDSVVSIVCSMCTVCNIYLFIYLFTALIFVC